MTAADIEKEALSRLRASFEAEGYRFVTEPRKADLPDFLLDKMPDALAIGPDETVVIEAKRHRTRATDHYLANLAQEISSRPGWRLLVVYAGEDQTEILPLLRAEKFQIDNAIQEARALGAQGRNRYAVMAAWSLFEALARRLYPEDKTPTRQALSPPQIVERLAMDGQVDVEEASRLRGLISARNRAVHGDLQVAVADSDIDFMLAKAQEINDAISG